MGFLGADTTNELYTMVTPCFTKVDDAKQYSLSDLKGDGYPKSELVGSAWKYGCAKGAFEVMVLKNDGNPDKTYYWVDITTGIKVRSETFGPGWFTYDTETGGYVAMTKEEMNAVKFDLGQSFWIAGSGYKLVSAGAVSPQRMEYSTTNELYTAVGNAMPVDTTLGNLYANGYPKSELVGSAWKYGCAKGAFELMILKNDGNPDKTYYWVDITTGIKVRSETFGPGWFTYDTETGGYVAMTKEEMNAVKIKAGQGFWVAGSGYNLVVPSPLAEEKPAEE